MRKPFVFSCVLMIICSAVFAGVDQPWNENDGGSTDATWVAAMFAIAAIWLFLENQKISAERARAQFAYEQADEALGKLRKELNQTNATMSELVKRHEKLHSINKKYLAGVIGEDQFFGLIEPIIGPAGYSRGGVIYDQNGEASGSVKD